jgi:hypothetical protein
VLTLKGAGAPAGCGDGLHRGRRFRVFEQRLNSHFAEAERLCPAREGDSSLIHLGSRQSLPALLNAVVTDERDAPKTSFR